MNSYTEAKAEASPTITEERKREIADKLSEELEAHLAQGFWGEGINGLNLPMHEEEWAKENLRWTILDESSKEDLLNE
jgi:hypothetical protein